MNKKLIAFLSILSLLVSFPLIQVHAAEGISQISVSTSIAKPKETVSINFTIDAPKNADQTYGIYVSLTGVKLGQSFGASSQLLQGNFGAGSWQANIIIPADAYSDSYRINFKGLGPGRPPSNLTPVSNVIPTISIIGVTEPIQPQIQISRITTDKLIYSPGDTVNINFESKIISGAVNSDTESPTILIKDTRSNLILRATPRSKESTAIGGYELGKWSAQYLLPMDILNTLAQVEVRFPGRNNITFGTEKGAVFQIQSLKAEVSISEIIFDKAVYAPGDKIKITFKTSASNILLSENTRPYLVLTDYEYSDLSSDIQAELLSGNLNSGTWMAVIDSQPFTALKDGDYLFAFYNRARNIQATGPVFKVRTPVKTQISCVKGKTTKKVSGTNPKCPKGYKVKA